MKHYLIFALLILSSVNLISQEKEPVNSSELIIEALQKYYDDQQDEAIELLGEINRSDTNYIESLVNKSYYALNQERYEEVLLIAEEGLNHFDNEYDLSFIVNKGISLSKLERFDEAINLFNDALEKYPVRNEFYTLLGSVYEEKKEYEKALEMYKKSVEMNLYDAEPHIRLGRMAYHEGKTSQFLMGFLMGILIDPNTDVSNGYLVSLNQLVQAKAESQEPKGLKFSDGDAYDEIDLILQNYSALNKSYKVDSKIDIPLVRQVQVMLEKLDYDDSSEGFWMKNYVRIFKDVYNNGQFEAFSYYLLQSSGNAKHQKIISKKSSDINNLRKYLQVTLSKYCAENPIMVEGEMKNYSRNVSNSLISSLGDYKGNNFDGPWYLYYDSGALEAIGYYDNGKAVGTWTWFYETGEKRREYTLKNELVSGTLTSYHKNGQIALERNFLAGELHGIERAFTSNGKEISYIEYEGSKANGKAISYYDIATPQYEYSLVDDRFDGEVKYFYDSGEVQGSFNYLNGEIDGEHKIFYRNGQVAIERNYSNGKLEGSWKSYYKDGTIKETANYKNGKIFGKNEVFDSDGKLTDETLFDENGKKNGVFTEFHDDGKPYYVSEFNKGVFTAFKYLDVNGEVLSSGDIKKSGTDFNGYYKDGTQYSNGIYKPDGREGEWTFNNEYGFLETKKYYKEGKQDGEDIDYYENGEISSKANYKEGEREGYFVSYYPDGKIYQEGFYKEGKLDNEWKTYNSMGLLARSEFYVDGDLHGFYTYYDPEGGRDYELVYNYGKLIGYNTYDANGEILQKIELDEGCGDVAVNFRNGAKRFETSFLNHIEHGYIKTYASTGTIIQEGDVFNSERNGKWTNRFDDGQVRSEGEYEYGDKIGTWKLYHSNGQLREIEEYKEGKLHGVNITYDDDGKLSNEITYKEGRRNGPTVFYIDGIKEHTRYYKDGKFVEYSYWLPNGDESEMISLGNGTGTVKSYYKNGNLAREYYMLNGEFDGPYKRYYENGNMERETFNDVGYDTGITKEYYNSGQLKMEYENMNDDRNGFYKKYHENGKLAEEGNYIDGTKHGDFKYFDQSGNLVKTTTYYEGDAF